MKNKIALVTGSTSGIGKATAQLLLDKGFTVIISSEKELSEDSVLKDFNNRENAKYLKIDISKKDDVTSARDTILKTYGKLDYLVANAGILPKNGGIDTITEELMDKIINTNLKGTFWTVKILGKLIQDTSNDGSIVCTTSVDGIIGEPYGVIYSATKAGIISFTKSFARYFKKPLVRVNAVAPGIIDTPLTASGGENPSATTDLSIIQRMGTAQEIANSITFLLSSESSFTTGQIIAVDGGFTLK